MKAKTQACIIAVILCLCMLPPITALGATNNDYYNASIREWITYQPISMMFITLPDTSPDGLHYLWDIPFGISAEELITQAKEKANINVVVTSFPEADGSAGRAHLAVDDIDVVFLFGYPIVYSYFGVLKDVQSVGLGANSTTGSSSLLYEYASLLVLGGSINASSEDIVACARAMYEGISSEYGTPTEFNFIKNKEEQTLVGADGSVDFKEMVELGRDDIESLYSTTFLTVCWGNVKLYVDFGGRTVSVSFYPDLI